jgi:Raf kinase inhibitor-like YbhB/YbcL family protein
VTILVSSSAFVEEGLIPAKYTCEGEDISPPLRWSQPPPGTRSIALICDDPDAPGGAWVHWVLYGLPPSVTELPEAIPTKEILPSGARQGINDFKRIGYGGPCPPPGAPHRYFFRVYALGSEIDLPSGATKEDLLGAMQGQILAEGRLMGKYKRERTRA